MSNALPEFEGREVTAATGRITGAGDGLSDPFRLEPVADEVGDYVDFLVRTRVDQVNHRPGKNESDGLTRQHTYKVERASRVTREVADKILAEDAERLDRLRAAESGQTAINNDGTIAGVKELEEHQSFSEEFGLPEEELETAGVTA